MHIPRIVNAIVNNTEVQANINNIGSLYLIDTTNSEIRFTGYGPGHHHMGIFKLKNGVVYLKNHSITGGNFNIDITSMAMVEKGASIEKKHLTIAWCRFF